ncbi:SN protein, partial [Rhynochetos jubatus]|nr:SN protein [Rhynochetos jubatus]
NHHPLPHTDPPRDPILTAFLETERGRLAIFRCSVASNPPAQLALLRGEELVATTDAGGSPSPRLSVLAAPNTLRVEMREVTPADEGTYTCTATNAHGTAAHRLYFRVQPALLLVSPSAEAREGDDVSLTCQVAGELQDDTVFSWYKNGERLRESPENILELPHVTSAATGTYHCRARGPAGASVSPAVALRVSYAPQEPSFISLVDPRGGRQAILLCTVDSVPPSDITLHRGPGSAPLASTRGPSDPRFTVQAAPNSLRVGMGGLEPWDAGVYVCSANNTYGAASASLRLDPGGVMVTVEPSPDVPEGSTVTVTCLATPWVGEEANYTWYKNSRWLRGGPSGTLVLTHVSSADTGSYRCRASGTRGSATSPTLSVTVLCDIPWRAQCGRGGPTPPPTANPVSPPHADPPRDVSVSTFLENRSGRAGIVLCTADSHPASTLALYRRGQLLASSLATAPGVRATPSRNALRVELGDVGPEDSGEYTCVAGNPMGNATAGAYFDVRTLAHLLAFTVLAWLLVALVGVATLALLAVKLWPR